MFAVKIAFVTGEKSRQKLGEGDEVVIPPGQFVYSQGTGFVVSSTGQLLTCAHVVGNQTNVTVWIEGGRQLGRVTAVDTNIDVALITLEGVSGESSVNVVFPADRLPHGTGGLHHGLSAGRCSWHRTQTE